MATGNPLQGMNVAQAAGAAFNIGFKIIAGAVVTLVALVLLLDLRGEELF